MNDTQLELIKVFFFLLLVITLTSCKLNDNRLRGSIGSTTPPTENPLSPLPPTLDNYMGEDPTLFGGGTEINPFIIVTAKQLNKIGEDTSLWDKHFALGRNIDLIEFSGSSFNLIGNLSIPFSGSLDGAGFTLSNFNYNTDATDNIGLFSVTEGALLKNLNIYNFIIVAGSSNNVGSLIGQAKLEDIVENVSLTKININGDGNNYGGVTGIINGDLLSIKLTGNANTISSSGSAVGGLTGSVWDSCPTKEKGSYRFFNNYSQANVSGGSNVGGLIGIITNTACVTTYNVVYSSQTHGQVDGDFNVGGMVGSSSITTFIDVHSSADVIGTTGYVGGLVGVLNRPVFSRSIYIGSSSGNVTGGFQVGGIVGSGNGDIQYVYSTGDIAGTSNVGGIAGYFGLNQINYSYTQGKVTCTAGKCGGILGELFSGQFTNSYFAGQASLSGANIGGLIGNKSGGIGASIRNFWDKDVSGVTDMCGFVDAVCNNSFGKTTAEMKNLATFNGPHPNEWSFASITNTATAIWRIDAGEYPRFSWLNHMPFAAGDGTLTNPFEIATADQFNTVGNNPYYNTKHFVISANIDFLSLSSTYIPWTDFLGQIDGQGNTLSNLTFLDAINSAALIAKTYGFASRPGNVKIQNINIDSFDITSSNSEAAALVVEYFDSGPIIKNVHISNSVINGDGPTGGICTGCYSIQNSSVTSTNLNGTSAAAVIGGLGARVDIIESSYSDATINSLGDSVGGLVGLLGHGVASYGGQVYIKNSYSMNSVVGNNDVGGLVGKVTLDSTIENSYTLGNVTANNSTAGGIIGNTIAPITLTHNYSKSIVSSPGTKGGYLGTNGGQTITYSQNYWNKESNPTLYDSSEGDVGDPNLISGKTINNLNSQSTFINWDFTSIWEINEGISSPSHK